MTLGLLSEGGCSCRPGEPLGDGRSLPQYFSSAAVAGREFLARVRNSRVVRHWSVHLDGRHVLGVVLPDGLTVSSNGSILKTKKENLET